MFEATGPLTVQEELALAYLKVASIQVGSEGD